MFNQRESWLGKWRYPQPIVTLSSDIISVSWLLDILARCRVKGSCANADWLCKLFWFDWMPNWAPPRAAVMTVAAVMAIWRPIGWCWTASPAGPPTCFWGSLIQRRRKWKTQDKKGNAVIICARYLLHHKIIARGKQLTNICCHSRPATTLWQKRKISNLICNKPTSSTCLWVTWFNWSKMKLSSKRNWTMWAKYLYELICISLLVSHWLKFAFWKI